MNHQVEVALRIVRENATFISEPCALGFPLGFPYNQDYAIIFCDQPEKLKIPEDLEKDWYYDEKKHYIRQRDTKTELSTCIVVRHFTKPLNYDELVRRLNYGT